ncbi:MAG TPA: 50S ribosomal protein L25 [Opitutaceae bacterium]|nr:50S ribosomal protein L25 [Opitutaceae bacterium]
MNQKLTLTVTPRAQTGRSASRRLRKGQRVPAILYGKHTSPEKLSVDDAELHRLLKIIAGRAKLIELTRADKNENALVFLQEVQRDALTDNFLHLDLHEVKADEKFEIRVPVHVVGESFGVKNENGVLEIALHHLRIRCLAKDLPEAINVDVTELKVGETIKVGSLKKVAGVEFRELPGQAVVSCTEVKEEVVEAPVVAEAVEGAIPAEGAVPAEGAAPAAGAAAPAAGAAAPGAPGAKPGAPAAAGAKGAAPAPGAKPGAPAAPGAKPGAPAAAAKPAKK